MVIKRVNESDAIRNPKRASMADNSIMRKANHGRN